MYSFALHCITICLHFILKKPNTKPIAIRISQGSPFTLISLWIHVNLSKSSNQSTGPQQWTISNFCKQNALSGGSWSTTRVVCKMDESVLGMGDWLEGLRVGCNSRIFLVSDFPSWKIMIVFTLQWLHWPLGQFIAAKSSIVWDMKFLLLIALNKFINVIYVLKYW